MAITMKIALVVVSVFILFIILLSIPMIQFAFLPCSEADAAVQCPPRACEPSVLAVLALTGIGYLLKKR